ncbi:MAG: hypothetical protein ACK6BG_06595 [Cyanobacteriota bacterium]
MQKFAFCDGTSDVWQFDTDQPGLLPYPAHSGGGNIRSLAYTANQQLVFVSGPSFNSIRKTTGPMSQTVLYTETMPTVYLSRARVRMIGPNEERIYFSSYNTSQGAEYVGEQIYQIRYLKKQIATNYMTIYPSQLTIPDPCDNGKQMAAYMSGDFAFGDDDTLYLSTGNIAGGGNVKLKCGIYRIKGAGPDGVTGTIERIYLGEGPITGLSFRSPKTLYFLRNNDIFKLDLAIKKVSLLATIPTQPGHWSAEDLTWVNNGFSQVFWWNLISFTYKVPIWISTTVWKMAIAFVLGHAPEPPDQPRSVQQDIEPN